VSVLEVLGRYYKGYIPEAYGRKEIQIRCPFHKDGRERRPSLCVNLENGLFFCHACGRGWSLMTFLIELGVDKGTAVEEVRDLDLGRVPAGEPETIVIPEWIIAGWKRKCPLALLEAGFSMDVLKEYEVGYDEERSRIVFPVRDHRGRLVAIQGRNLVGEPRYKMYKEELEDILGFKIPHVPLKRCVWNLNRWYDRGFRGSIDELILVEGVKKALWLIQHGFQNTVSIFSSYMSDEQFSLLSRLSIKRVISLLDNDDAGKKGTKRVMDLFGCCAVAPDWPDGVTQPDDLDVGGLVKLVESARKKAQGGTRWMFRGERQVQM